MAKKNPHAAALGRLGGKAGTKAQQQARRENMRIARKSRHVDKDRS